MNDVRLTRLTGVLLILTPVAFNVFFTLLSVTFEYPDILHTTATDSLVATLDVESRYVSAR